jgi:nonribosomal peptide synthetase DhbF
LRRLPHVDDAVVTAHQDRAGDRRLVAYVVGAGPETKDLHRALTDRLPAHLVPASFVILDRLPLSPNGKIDRRALPAPAQIPVAASQPPRDETERRIAHVWQQVLDVPDVGRDHNFLALGGDSFKALRAAQAIDPRLSPLALLRHPTVAQLAEHLRTT